MNILYFKRKEKIKQHPNNVSDDFKKKLINGTNHIGLNSEKSLQDNEVGVLKSIKLKLIKSILTQKNKQSHGEITKERKKVIRSGGKN